MKTEILHTGVVECIEDLLTTDEEIIWKGAPLSKFRPTLLEMGAHWDAASSSTNAFGLVFGLTLYGCIYFYHYGHYWGILMSLFLGVFFLLLPDYIKHQRALNTKYVFTNKRIYFQLWRWGKTSFHFIPLKEIKNMVVSSNPKNFGVIYLIVKNPKKINFSTYDFGIGERRHQPTLEIIKDVEQVADDLKHLIKNQG